MSDPEAFAGPDETLDVFQRGAFRLLQGRKGHRAGMDALLLASLVPEGARGRLLDLGANSGAVAFAVTARCDGVEAVLADRDEKALDRARRGIALNGWEARARTLAMDIEAERAEQREAGLDGDRFDIVLANPPFNGAGHRNSPDAARAGAHGGADLGAWFQTARRCLRSGGLGGFIVRPEALPLFLSAGGEGVRLRAVHPNADAAASRILVAWTKGRRTPLAIEPPLVVHEADGEFTPEAKRIFEGGR